MEIIPFGRSMVREDFPKELTVTGEFELLLKWKWVLPIPMNFRADGNKFPHFGS